MRGFLMSCINTPAYKVFAEIQHGGNRPHKNGVKKFTV